MAEGFAKTVGKEWVLAESAGSHPVPSVNPFAVQVMQEKGIDLSGKRPKSAQNLWGESFDYVVTMGCGDACPVIPTQKQIDWDIPDPKGKSLDVFRDVRDLIRGKVGELLEEIKSYPES